MSKTNFTSAGRLRSSAAADPDVPAEEDGEGDGDEALVPVEVEADGAMEVEGPPPFSAAGFWPDPPQPAKAAIVTPRVIETADIRRICSPAYSMVRYGRPYPSAAIQRCGRADSQSELAEPLWNRPAIRSEPPKPERADSQYELGRCRLAGLKLRWRSRTFGTLESGEISPEPPLLAPYGQPRPANPITDRCAQVSRRSMRLPLRASKRFITARQRFSTAY